VVVVIVLSREQSEQIAQVSAELEISPEEATRLLLSGPLAAHIQGTQDAMG
jgi:hypothetical protein